MSVGPRGQGRRDRGQVPRDARLKTQPLESHLLARRDRGEKIFVAYLTAGLPDPQAFLTLVEQVSSFADAIEVGLPFSDPIMDGPVIQQASSMALSAGVGAARCLELVEEAQQCSRCPLLIMSYYNPIHRMGEERFVDRASSAGVAGMIVPDLPFEASSSLGESLAEREIALVQMIAPTTSPERARGIVEASRGFIYAVSRLGVTGEQTALQESAKEVMDRFAKETRIPVLLGIGISNGEQARAASMIADGVIIGSALMRRVLEGDTSGAVGLASTVRKAI